MKKCPDCQVVKDLTQFGDNKAQPDGRAFYCRSCFSQRNAATYRRKREREGHTVRERPEVPHGHKYCPSCRDIKPLASFHRAPKQSGGRSSYCATCKVARDGATRVKRDYGITMEERDALVARQGGTCAICRSAPAVHVDHDHATGAVRGVVCFSCNVGIGHFKDSAELMRRAIDYLETTTWQRTPVCTGVYRLTTPRRAAPPSSSSSALQHLISSRRGASSP